MPALTILQIDNMIASLKQHKKYNPDLTLEQAYQVWRSLAE